MAKILRTLVLCALLTFVAGAAAQKSHADKLFDRGAYFEALPIYKKEAKNKSPERSQHALLRLGECYKALNDFTMAEVSYAKALELSPEIPSEVYLKYAQILKINDKYDLAAEQYSAYLKLNPKDQAARRAKRFCTEIQTNMNRPVEYTVTNVQAINTSNSEFSPYVFKNKLLFIAERARFDFTGYERNDYNGQPYLNLYEAPIQGNVVKKEKPFSNAVNSEYHDGPGCLSADGTTLYFTRVSYVNKRNFVNQSKIYTAAGTAKSWKKIKPLELSSDDYSIAHPSISQDNNTLYFTSDMPGGFGGKDIWMCKREGDGWEAPINLGPDVNTTGDEMFPSIRQDGVLFFSSDGLPGYGGLDVFSARKLEGKWVIDRNEGPGINSRSDDFGITFLNDSTGYFSSNRLGGKGSDDIYNYRFHAKKLTSVDGTVLLSENIADKAKQKKVLLLDEKGKVLDSTFTNQKGYFEFRNLDPDKKYMTSIEESDPSLQSKARFYLAAKDSTIQRVSGKFEGNRFVFKNLPYEPGALPELTPDGNLVLSGTVSQDGKKPLKNLKVKLVNELGEVMEETTTNENGSFAFRNIPSDKNYVVSIEEGDIQLPEGTKIVLSNRAGKEIRSFYKAKEKFVFKILAADKAVIEEMELEEMSLAMGLYGYMYDQDKKPLANIRVKVKEENGGEEVEWVTADNGKFTFKNLSTEKKYIFSADEKDPHLKGVRKIFIADAKGRVYKVVELGVNGKFEFKILEIDKSSMGEFEVSDPWLKLGELKNGRKKPLKVTKGKEEDGESEFEMSITIVENIHYPFGSWELDEDARAILDKAADAMKDYPKLLMEISSHTDSQSTNEFNLMLSNKRAQRAVDYVVSRGVDRKRLKGKGYGEAKLINNCADGVDCTDAEHMVNRRTEFKITKPSK